MSYSFGMYFKQVGGMEEAFKIALQFSEECFKHAEEHMKQNVTFSPPFRLSTIENENANKYWLRSLFTFRFIYWEKEKLLSVSGFNYPHEAEALFDSHIIFQNSTDQSYDFDEWSDKIDVFKSKKDIYQNSSADSLFKQMRGYSREEIAANLDYYRKSALYEDIFASLHLNKWLCDKSDDYFTRFAITPIDSMEKEMDLHTLLKAVLRNYQ